jgi:diguanylate cyclase (GGDEF)-like protein
VPELKRGEARFLQTCVESFAKSFEVEVAEVLARELRGIIPEPVADLRQQLQLLLRQLESREPTIRVHDAMDGLLKRVLLVERRRAAQAIELPLSKVVEPNVVGALNRELRRFEDVMTAEWFSASRPQRVPRLTDFLSIRFAADAAPDKPPLVPRAYDEKFHVLEAPALFLPDLAHYRWECSLRDASITVAFVDIDDFKAKNAALTEVVVDLKVLPPFMELIEAFVFARGHAYRYGGDEYVLLLPNVDASLGGTMLAELGRRVSSATFRGTDLRLSITQGVAVVDPDCPLTDREILARANQAKDAAKSKKKGTIFVTEAPEWSPRPAG